VQSLKAKEALQIRTVSNIVAPMEGIKMGWKTFETKPPKNKMIDIYFENDDFDYWIIAGEYDSEKEAIVFLILDPRYYSKEARALCWRERAPPPRSSFISKCKPVNILEDAI
jgi:hypothetical protein